MSAYQLDQASGMSKWVVENKKSTQNKHHQHEAELCFKAGRPQSEQNPTPHYRLQIVGDIKVASRLPSYAPHKLCLDAISPQRKQATLLHTTSHQKAKMKMKEAVSQEDGDQQTDADAK